MTLNPNRWKSQCIWMRVEQVRQVNDWGADENCEECWIVTLEWIRRVNGVSNSDCQTSLLIKQKHDEMCCFNSRERVKLLAGRRCFAFNMRSLRLRRVYLACVHWRVKKNKNQTFIQRGSEVKNGSCRRKLFKMGAAIPRVTATCLTKK